MHLAFPPYTLDAVLGEGGMGRVFRAEHPGLGIRVALKVLKPAAAASAAARQRFVREAQSAARLRHPGIVRVYDVGTQVQEDGTSLPFQVMELLEGEPLDGVLERVGVLPVGLACELVIDVSLALFHAHSAGIVHRDLKPANIIVKPHDGGWAPVLTDFGIAKLVGPGVRDDLTVSSSLLGTPRYMSPEQVHDSATVGPRSDQYSAAAVLYRCVTGQPLFATSSLSQMLQDVACGAFSPPSVHDPSLAGPFEAVVLKALSVSPTRRHASLLGFAGALVPFVRPERRSRYAERVAAARPVPDAARSAREGSQASVPTLERLSERANLLDTLTGVPTRLHFLTQLRDRMDEAGEGPVSLLLVDIDDFSRINDNFGPQVGDKVLATVAKRLGRALRGDSFVARVSGDGFALVLVDGSEPERVSKRVHEYFRRPFAVRGQVVHLSAVVGHATASDFVNTVHGLVHAAGLALHHAQGSPGLQTAAFRPAFLDEARGRHRLETQLRESLLGEQFALMQGEETEALVLHAEPEVSLPHRRLRGVALSPVWRGPEGQTVAGRALVRLAEDAGLVEILSDWMLRASCRFLAELPGETLGVSLELSPLHLLARDAFLGSLDLALADAGVAPARLRLQVPESVLSLDVASTLRAAARVGVRVGLSDFGSGAANLLRLRSFPFTHLELGEAFVEDLDDTLDPRDPTFERVRATGGEWMLRALASLARGLGMVPIVSGLTEAWQVESVQRAGCSEVRGPVVGASLQSQELLRRLDAGEPLTAPDPEPDAAATVSDQPPPNQTWMSPQ